MFLSFEQLSLGLQDVAVQLEPTTFISRRVKGTTFPPGPWMMDGTASKVYSQKNSISLVRRNKLFIPRTIIVGMYSGGCHTRGVYPWDLLLWA